MTKVGKIPLTPELYILGLIINDLEEYPSHNPSSLIALKKEREILLKALGKKKDRKDRKSKGE